MNTAHSPFAKLHKRLRNTSGQALVEMALTIPILSLILIGVADLAYVMHAAISVSNAAKAGAQYAVQNGFTAVDSSGIMAAAAAEAPNLTLTTTPTYGCVCSDGSASTCKSSDCSSSHIEQVVTVATSATVTPLVHLPALPKTVTISGKAVQKCLE